MHRGRAGDADDRALAGLQPGDGLSPRLGTCAVEQREALLLQLVRCDLDGLSVRDLELETLACGTGRSTGQSGVPKHACAA
jgi:hypothetical protein